MANARGTWHRSELAVSPEQGEVGEEGLGEPPCRYEWLEHSVHAAHLRDATPRPCWPTGDGEVEVGGRGGRMTFFKLYFS